nr:hypothetical protein [Tanacetum cinerariifolium]
MKGNPAIWSRKLDDALWAFRTAYKTPTETTPYKHVVGIKRLHDDLRVTTTQLRQQNDAGTSTTPIPGPVATEEKAQKKNDVKARSMLLMALPNEHLITFNQYKDAKTLFAAIQTRFGGNEAIKKTMKTLLKQIQPNRSQLVHKDLVQIHEDDLEKMDLKWQLALLSMRIRRTVNVEDTSSNAMVAIDGAGFDWCFMEDDEVPTNMALVAFLESEFNKSEFNLPTYKRGLASVKEQLVFYKMNMVLFCEQTAVLKRDISYKDSKISVLKRSQIPDNSKKCLGYESYHVVPPHPIGLFSPPKLDLSNSGLEEFQQPKFKSYVPKTSKSVSENISNEVKESPNALLVKKLVLDDKLEKKTVFPTAAKKEFVRPKQQEKPVRKPVKYAKMYRSQGPKENQRNWNNLNSQQLGSDFVMYNKACFVCGSFDHLQANCNYHQRKGWPIAVNTARPNLAVVNAVRVNQGHPQKEDQGYVDSRCSRHMTRNMSYHSDFKEFDEGYVTFGGRAKGGRITGKGTIKIGLLKVSRKNNMYIVDMKKIVPKESLTCLVAKATLDESMLWHRRLGHINFKTINKLVKENLVRGLPPKHFENDQTCVDFLKGKQHKASCDGPKWLFDIDVLTKSMNYVPVVAGTNSNDFVDGLLFDSSLKNANKDEPQPSSDAGKKNDDGSGVQIRRMIKTTNEQGFFNDVYEGKAHEDLHTCLFSCFLSQEEPKKMDLKSAFLYGKIEEEVYVCQPPGFEDLELPDKVYKVEKALYGLHQAPKAWYELYLPTY